MPQNGVKPLPEFFERVGIFGEKNHCKKLPKTSHSDREIIFKTFDRKS